MTWYLSAMLAYSWALLCYCLKFTGFWKASFNLNFQLFLLHALARSSSIVRMHCSPHNFTMLDLAFYCVYSLFNAIIFIKRTNKMYNKIIRSAIIRRTNDQKKVQETYTHEHTIASGLSYFNTNFNILILPKIFPQPFSTQACSGKYSNDTHTHTQHPEQYLRFDYSSLCLSHKTRSQFGILCGSEISWLLDDTHSFIYWFSTTNWYRCNWYIRPYSIYFHITRRHIRDWRLSVQCQAEFDEIKPGLFGMSVPDINQPFNMRTKHHVDCTFLQK